MEYGFHTCANLRFANDGSKSLNDHVNHDHQGLIQGLALGLSASFALTAASFSLRCGFELRESHDYSHAASNLKGGLA